MSDNYREQHTAYQTPDPDFSGNVKKKKKTAEEKGLIVFTIVCIAALAATIFSVWIFGTGKTVPVHHTYNSIKSPFRKSNFTFRNFFPSGKYIAVLYIDGVIEEENQTYNQQQTEDIISDLAEDPRNIGIMLHINSPGGSVYCTDEIFIRLQKYKSTGKQVSAYLGQMAASGGYYMACAADTITANRNTLTGSIGVIAGQSVDLTALMEKHGIKVTTITAGKNKNMLSINSPLTEEQQSIMQAIADEAYEQFTGIVAESRQLPAEKVTALADGRIYTAQQAKELGLIDKIATFDVALEDFQQSFSEDDDIDIEYFNKMKEKGFFDSLYGIAGKGLSLLSKNQTDGLRILLELADTCNTPEQTVFPAYLFRQ